MRLTKDGGELVEPRVVVGGGNEKELESFLLVPTNRGMDEAGQLRVDCLWNVFDEQSG